MAWIGYVHCPPWARHAFHPVTRTHHEVSKQLTLLTCSSPFVSSGQFASGFPVATAACPAATWKWVHNFTHLPDLIDDIRLKVHTSMRDTCA